MSRFHILGILAAALAALVIGMPGLPAAAQGPSEQIDTIFDNGNIEAVQNRPTQPTVFVLSEPTRIVTIKTYHWNNGRGARPGTIAVRSEGGQTFGPWQAKGQPGQGGVPNAYWIASPNVDLPPGQYTVIDSDPSTWAQNATSGGSGFASAEGHVIADTGQPAASPGQPAQDPTPSPPETGSPSPTEGAPPPGEAAPPSGPPTAAQGDICTQLWIDRNSIYKARGYCFKTQRAISHFGNAGCLYDVEDDVPLTRDDRARIARIQREEIARGCR